MTPNVDKLINMAFESQKDNYKMTVFKAEEDKRLEKRTILSFETEQEMKNMINGLLMGNNLLSVIEPIIEKAIQKFEQKDMYDKVKNNSQTNKALNALYNELYNNYELCAFLYKYTSRKIVQLSLALIRKPNTDNKFDLPNVFHLIKVDLTMVCDDYSDDCDKYYNIIINTLFNNVNYQDFKKSVNPQYVNNYGLNIILENYDLNDAINDIKKCIEKKVDTKQNTNKENNLTTTKNCLVEMKELLLKMKEENPTEMAIIFQSMAHYTHLPFVNNLTTMKEKIADHQCYNEHRDLNMRNLLNNGLKIKNIEVHDLRVIISNLTF